MEILLLVDLVLTIVAFVALLKIRDNTSELVKIEKERRSEELQVRRQQWEAHQAQQQQWGAQ